MDTKYEIIPLGNEPTYSHLIILCTPHSAYDYVDEIAGDLEGTVRGTVLIDQILHAGNGKKRFLSFRFDGTKLKDGRFARVPKDSELRKLACDFLNDADLVDSPALTSVQSRMIRKGIAI